MFYWRFYKERMKEYPWTKRPIAILSLMNLVLSLTAILFAYISKFTLDGVLDSNTDVFRYGLIGLIAIIIFQWILKIVNQRYLSIHQAITHKRLQKTFFDSLIRTEMVEINARYNGEWMNNLDSDVVRLSTGLLDVLPRFVFMIGRFVLALAILLFLDVTMALIITGSGVVIYLFGILFKNEMKKRHHHKQDAEGDVRSFLQEQLDHVEVIKTFEAESYTLNYLDTYQSKYMDAKIQQQKLTIRVGTTIQALFMIVYAGILVFGAYRVSLGNISVGGLVAILQLVQYLQSPFRLANTLLPTFSAMEGSYERLEKLNSLQKEPNEQYEVEPFSSIQIINLSYAYPNKETIIQNLNAEIQNGQIVQIVGPSGIGKTTLFHLFLGLLHPTSGILQIKTNNQTYSIDSRTRSYFTYVPQRILVKSGTIKENIIYNRDSILDSQLQNICTICEIHKDIIALENGYDTIIGEHGIGLSEGQLQRLAIARAIIGREPIILLDEITSALDQQTELKILKNMTQKLNKTILIVSHRDLPKDIIKTKIVL